MTSHHRPALLASLVLAITATVVAADKIDPRLATVRKAFVTAADDLGDDRPVAVCVADRLARSTPIETVKTIQEADVVLTIQNASVGKHPKAEIVAALPADGTKLWEGGSKTRGFNLVGRNMTCVIADDLISNLRDAMKKARDK
jgi:hypothetical protein